VLGWEPSTPLREGMREDLRLDREQYYEPGKAEPSGSQDMAGLVYPGINRFDYDFAVEGGYFPCHVESNNDAPRSPRGWSG
jgi:hypothetical protein